VLTAATLRVAADVDGSRRRYGLAIGHGAMTVAGSASMTEPSDDVTRLTARMDAPTDRAGSTPSTSELSSLGAPIRLRDGSHLRIRQWHRSDTDLLMHDASQAHRIGREMG
jgi:hypothetical protein